VGDRPAGSGSIDDLTIVTLCDERGVVFALALGSSQCSDRSWRSCKQQAIGEDPDSPREGRFLLPGQHRRDDAWLIRYRLVLRLPYGYALAARAAACPAFIKMTVALGH